MADPEAVMVKAYDAIVAVPAMRTSGWPPDLARAAELEVTKACVAEELSPVI